VTENPGSLSNDAIVERGRWLAAGAVVVAFTGAAVLLVTVLTTLEYDFEDGALAPFSPARGAIVLVAGSVLAGVVLFSGVTWRRWAATLGYAAGASWLLFLAEFEPAMVPAVVAAALCLGVATLALLVPSSVQRFFAEHEARGGRLAQPLGQLASASDARRWISFLDHWSETGVRTPRERERLSRTLDAWASAHPDMRDRFADDLERLAPKSPGRAALDMLRRPLDRILRRSRAAS
jgi:hypothetical protein